MPGAGICGLRGELLDFSRICAAIVIEKIPGEMYNLKIARSIWAGFKALPRECRSIYLNRAVPAAARCAVIFRLSRADHRDKTQYKHSKDSIIKNLMQSTFRWRGEPALQQELKAVRAR